MYLGVFICPGVKGTTHCVLALKQPGLDGPDSQRFVGVEEILEGY